ncbi:unnamed protein product [Urochloa humidicola]
MAAKTLPPYGRRAGLVPRRPEDFAGGGAFPEVHVPQYPLSMGLRGDPDTPPPSSNVLALTVDAARGGRVAFDAVVRQGENAAKIVYSTHADLLPKIAAVPDHHNADADADDAEIEATIARTRAALQAIINAAAHPATTAPRRRDECPAFVKYRPAAAALRSGAAGERVVRFARAQEDPVLPPRHRRRRAPPSAAAGSSPPVTVMHSPPRPVSRQDAEGWKIQPCVSDWKNAKGYCIPLDKRVASGGRLVRDDVQISDGFAGLSEALSVAERKAMEAIETRGKVRTELKMKRDQRRERELRGIASAARAEAAAAAVSGGAAPPSPPADEEEEERRTHRDMVREERRREAVASSGKKQSRVARDRDRDVGERIALGMASTGGAAGEVGYDERLFNQDAGVGSGFAADDVYSVYSGRLFAARPATTSALYGPSRHAGDSGVHGDADDDEEEIVRIARTERFKPDRGFSGAAERPVGKRGRPVEFGTPEESAEADDPFGLDRYMTRVKEGKKH